MRFIACCFLFLTSTQTHCLSENRLRMPNHKNMVVCNNGIVNDIPGGAETVFLLGKQYLESMKNNTKIEKFESKNDYT